MRFLANENFPGAAVTRLETAGHDVVWVRIAAPGATDSDVLAWAAREERILLTFDRDFGELARGSVLPPKCGIVLLARAHAKAWQYWATAGRPGNGSDRLGWSFLCRRAGPRSNAATPIRLTAE